MYCEVLTFLRLAVGNIEDRGGQRTQNSGFREFTKSKRLTTINSRSILRDRQAAGESEIPACRKPAAVRRTWVSEVKIVSND